jgi:hypothetical protein
LHVAGTCRCLSDRDPSRRYCRWPLLGEKYIEGHTTLLPKPAAPGSTLPLASSEDAAGNLWITSPTTSPRSHHEDSPSTPGSHSHSPGGNPSVIFQVQEQATGVRKATSHAVLPLVVSTPLNVTGLYRNCAGEWMSWDTFQRHFMHDPYLVLVYAFAPEPAAAVARVFSQRLTGTRDIEVRTHVVASWSAATAAESMRKSLRPAELVVFALRECDRDPQTAAAAAGGRGVGESQGFCCGGGAHGRGGRGGVRDGSGGNGGNGGRRASPGARPPYRRVSAPAEGPSGGPGARVTPGEYPVEEPSARARARACPALDRRSTETETAAGPPRLRGHASTAGRGRRATFGSTSGRRAGGEAGRRRSKSAAELQIAPPWNRLLSQCLAGAAEHAPVRAHPARLPSRAALCICG